MNEREDRTKKREHEQTSKFTAKKKQLHSHGVQC